MTASNPHPGTLERAEQLLRDGQYERARGMIANLHGQTLPSSARGRALAIDAVSVESLGGSEDALRVIEETMKEEGDDLAFGEAAAAAFAEFGAHQHAEDFLRNLCDLQPENPLHWHNLGVSCARLDQFESALAAFEAAFEQDPEFLPALSHQGYCLEALDRCAEAAAKFERYLEKQPDDRDVWVALAAACTEIGDADRAKYASEQAERLQPSNLESAR